MISRAIWNESALVNFSKTTNCKLLVFEKFTRADLSQIALEIM